MNYKNLMKNATVKEDVFEMRGAQMVVNNAQLLKWNDEIRSSEEITEEQFGDGTGVSLLIELAFFGTTFTKNWKGYVSLDSKRGDTSGWVKFTAPSLEALGIEDVLELDGHYFDIEFPKKGRRFKSTKTGEWMNSEVPVFIKHYGEQDPSALYETSEADQAAKDVDFGPVDTGHKVPVNEGIEQFIDMIVSMGDSAAATLAANAEVMEYLTSQGKTIDDVLASA